MISRRVEYFFILIKTENTLEHILSSILSAMQTLAHLIILTALVDMSYYDLPFYIWSKGGIKKCVFGHIAKKCEPRKFGIKLNAELLNCYSWTQKDDLEGDCKILDDLGGNGVDDTRI